MRKNQLSRIQVRASLFPISILTLAIAGCGGGGSDAPATVVQPPAATTITITGVAAKGAAFAGATVTASNPSGTVGSTVPVGADGTYSMTLPIDVATPIVLTASRATPTGETESYSTVIADRANTTANITPVTNVIAAMLSPTGVPSQLAAQVASGTQISQATLAARTASVQAVLQSASTALGVPNVNPVTDTFAANGTGYDRLLDSINASIIPVAGRSNIEIGLRVRSASDTDQPPVSQFSSNQTTTLPALPVVAAASFVVTGTSAKLAQLMTDSTACYALPLATRVSTATAATTTAVGNAVDVSAPACKGMFFNNDPASYKSNGALVGRTASGAGNFTGIFAAANNGQVFDNAVYEYTLANGDVAVSYRTTVPGANGSIVNNIVRLDPADQKLKFIGNQYAYQGSIQPFMQRREFVTLGQSTWNYLSSGYTLTVDNTGQFAKVEVVTPNGRTMTLVPDAAVSFLRFSTSTGSSNFLRLRSEFIDTANTLAVSSKLTSERTSLAFESPELTEAEMLAAPAQSSWTFRYFLTGNTTTTPNAVQVYKTRARALSIAEFRARAMPALTASWIASTAASATANGRVPLDSFVPVSPIWTVPTGALAPTSSTLFGNYLNGNTATSTSSFTDTSSFSSTATTTNISCSTQGAADTHCANATGGGFKPGSLGTSLNLVGTDSLGRQFASHYSAYQLTIAP
jgi:hypothetical protein